MADAANHAGGCFCGQLRYTARGAPRFAGYCCCADCRRASGSGFVPFMGFSADAMTITGETREICSVSIRGTETVRSRCPDCGVLVFGGRRGIDTTHTVYAGSLDDPALFRPQMVIFERDRPDWVRLPEGLSIYETMPA